MTTTTIDRTRATEYETIFILRADIDSDASEKAIGRVTTAIEQQAGTLLKLESWGKRKLAYLIGRHRRGFYVYVRYLGYQGLVTEIERNLRLLDTVLRFITVKIRSEVNPASITVDPEETKVRRIEITEDATDERDDSVEHSLGLADEQRPAERAPRMPDPTPPAPPTDNAAAAEPAKA